MGTDLMEQELQEILEKEESNNSSEVIEEETKKERKIKPKKVVVGIDLGFKQVKGRCGNVKKIFPSIAEIKNKNDIIGVKESSAMIQIGERYYRVGAGYYDFNMDKVSSGLDIPKLCYMLALLKDECGFDTINTLVTGLPISAFNENRETLTAKCLGRFEFKCNGKDYSINVENVQTIPQGVAAYYDYILEENGEPSNDENKLRIAANKIGIVDIGGRTTDIAAMNSGNFMQGLFLSSNVAVWDLQSKMRRKIQDEYKTSVSVDDLDRILKEKKAIVRSKTVDVSDLIEQAAEEMFRELNAEIRTTLINIDAFVAIILTGGGAQVCAEAARRTLSTDIIVMDDSEFNNVNGYYKTGLVEN